MFCEWCGRRLEQGTVVCPFCKGEQAPLRSGNGFWDLCQLAPEPAAVRAEDYAGSAQSNAVIPRVTKKETGKLKLLIAGIVVLLLLLALGVMVFWNLSLSSQLRQLKSAEADNGTSVSETVTQSPSATEEQALNESLGVR